MNMIRPALCRMERLIDEMPEQVIDEYVDRKLIKNIDEDNRRHLKKYARKLQHFHQGGKRIYCPMCKHLYSKGSCWRDGCKIQTICLAKHPGSRRAEDEEQCYAKCDKTEFLEHLASRVDCIYHKLASEFEALDSCLNKTFGDRVIFYFNQSIISYAHMYRFICRETRTLSPAKNLMVDYKTILETRKWASFYTKKEKMTS